MKVLVLLLMLNFYFQLNAQVLEESYSIKTKNFWVSTNKKSSFKYREKELIYNKKGQLIEEIIFNRRHKIISHKAFQYDNDLLIREFDLNSKGKIIQRTDYFYKKGILIRKTTVNQKGKITRDEEIIFEYHN